jgi:two-component system sensor histidine kinase PilS (NtrC family)
VSPKNHFSQKPPCGDSRLSPQDDSAGWSRFAPHDNPSQAAVSPTITRQRITWIMLFRVILLTLLLIGVVMTNYLTGTPWRLSSFFVTGVLGLIAALYAISIVFGIFLQQTTRLLRLFYIQLIIDLLAISFAVHATGGASSGYTALYLIVILSAAVIDGKRGAFLVCVSSLLLFLAVSVLGYIKILPLIPSQIQTPWQLSPEALFKNIGLNMAAFGAVAVLSAHLGDLLGRAGQQVSAHRQALNKLASHHNHILRSMTSGLISVDREGVIVTFNEAAENISGIDKSDAIATPLDEILTNVAAVEETARLTLTRKDGNTLPVEVTVTDLWIDKEKTGGKIYLIQDRSELERMEQEVQAAERLALLGRFAAGVAHEIRNPLASISGSIELLRQSASLEGENERLMNIVLREVERLDRLINEILVFARPSKPDFKSLTLNNLINEVCELFSHDHPQLEVVQSVDLSVVVRADDQKLRQVMLNLLLNAQDALKGTGRIEIGLAQENGFAVISVADHGKGMERETRDRLFEPFFTTKPGGTGLGMAIVNQIVADHGGRIEVDSALDKGTTFRILLPQKNGLETKD